VPPPEVAARGLDAIRSYWRQEQEAGVDYLAEAKLLIVGEPGAGKTSLAKKILDPSYRLDSAEESTEGINVLAWQFPTVVRARDQSGARMLQRDYRVNIWDFGGQEIYHATHQFFLTKRSVYALVTDERKEDTDFEYWLEVVNLLSDGSPVVIIQNRKQGRGQGIDYGALRQRYPNMIGAIALNLADNSGLDIAVTKLRHELEQLPHIGTALPKTWRDVRLVLEADERNHISAEEFFAICASNGFTRREDMSQLGDYLHDLGICLFFQDDPLLAKTVILKPEWGTSAVYRVLDDPKIAQSLGVFGRDDLRRIWHEPSYRPMIDELLQLMMKFGLCYQVPGSDTFIAPQLLSPSRPPYTWDEADNLVLRYKYDVMPKGIVRRLIVALHDLIVPGDHVWRNGVIFEHDGSTAEVIEDYRRRRLSIRLRDGDPRVLLGIINHALDIIHRSYPRIRFEKFRPCDCETCSASTEPALFAVRDLEDFARTGDRIQCRASRKLVDPVGLLTALGWRPAYPTDGVVKVDRPETAVMPEVFVSYKWGGDSDALVDEMQHRLCELGVRVTRDKNEIKYRDSIRQFMRRLGAGKCIIVILDKAYLRSKYCMYELVEIASHPEFASRVFPVVMSDAEIFDPVKRLGYVKYWEGKRSELDEAMREVGQENLHGIREELDLYETIRNTIAGLMQVLGDMNTLTPDIHRDTDFADLYQSLQAALS
jgi:internalin A